MSIRRTCMRDQVRDLLVSRILDGSYPPGTRLKELTLAAECNVSQAPVREALRELEALGLLQSERYRGTRVRSADIQQLREAYELRALLEARAVQLAVPCSAEVLRNLRGDFEGMRLAADRGDYYGYAEAAVNFHRILVVAGGNATFLRTWDSLQWDVRSRIAVRRMEDLGVGIDVFVDAHAKILRALEIDDGTGAVRELGLLMDQTLSLLATESPLPQSCPAETRA